MQPWIHIDSCRILVWNESAGKINKSRPTRVADSWDSSLAVADCHLLQMRSFCLLRTCYCDCNQYCSVCLCCPAHVTSFLSLQTDSLKCVAQASKNRSLADFEKVCVRWTPFRMKAAVIFDWMMIITCPPASPQGTNRVQSWAEGWPHHQHPPDQTVWQPAGAEPHQGHRTFLQGPGKVSDMWPRDRGTLTILDSVCI